MEDSATTENQQMFFALYTCIGVFGIVGNGLTILTFWQERRRSVFHLQLAVANIISLSNLAFAALSALRGRWMFGDTLCQWFGFQAFFAGYVELSFTCIICMETFIATCFPQKYEKLPSLMFDLVSAGVWIYSLIFSLAPLFGWNRYSVDHLSTSCGIDMYNFTDSNYSYLATTHFIYLTLALTAGVCLILAYAMRSDELNPFQPLLNNKELQKISCLMFIFGCLDSLPFYLRAIYFMRGRPPFFNSYLGVEFSHLAMKVSCLLQPASYMMTSQTFRNFAISKITGVNPSKKNA